MSNALAQFVSLFAGRTSCYGVHVPEAGVHKEGEKLKGASFTEKQPLTISVYEDHINGIKSIGVVPINEDNKVNFAAIDVDVYPLDPVYFCKFFSRFGLPFTMFRSKSGGAHAFIFFKRPVAAKDVIPQLRRTLDVLGLPRKTEVFPKQAADTEHGNWINLPYFAAYETTRYAYDDYGRPMEFEDAMEWVSSKRCNLVKLKDALDCMPFSEAPPCLQKLYLNGLVTEENHNRNKFLFNACVYLKGRNPEDYERRLKQVNESLPEPMDETELERTVLHSFKNGEYSYQCEEPWLSDFCNKEECSTRKYGKSSMYVSDFSFERLRHMDADPPYYVWTVNGIDMTFYNESELRKQDKFSDYCIRYLHKCPNRLKDTVWVEILNKALSNIEVIKPEEGELMLSETAILKSNLREFLVERQLAQSPGQISLGLAFFDKDLGYCFRPVDFLNFLELMKRTKVQGTNHLHQQLKGLGAYATKIYNPVSKRAFRVWAIHAERLNALEDAEEENATNPSNPLPSPQTLRKSDPAGSLRASPAERLRKAALRQPDIGAGDTPLLDFSDNEGDF